MKKLYRPLCFVAAVAAMSLTSCQKENFNPAGEGETVTITVHANVEEVANATKTRIEGQQVLWDENEEMKVIAFNNANPENTGSESVSTEFTPSADFTTATFKDIMITRADNYPLENNEWTAYYKRATALNCMTLSGITDDIKSVTITFPEGQQAAGRRYFNLATGEAGEIYNKPTNVVTVNYATPLKAGNGENDVWFTSWNVNVKTGEAITVKAESATKIYTKTLTATKEVAIMENYLNIFPFDMTGAEVEDVELTKVSIAEFLAAEVSDNVWYELTGTIANLSNTEYGNFYLVDETGNVYVYGLTAEKVSSNDKSFSSLGLKEGDIVTLIGTRDEYEGDPQVGGPAYYVSHTEGSPIEPEIESISVADFNNKDVDPTVFYQLTGTVENITNGYYGNFDLTDQTGSVYVYGLSSTKGAGDKNVLSTLGIKEGDILTICGTRGEFKGTIQVMNAYYVSHEVAPYCEATPLALNVSSEAGTTTFNISSNEYWMIESNNPAYTVSPEEGTGDATITVTYPANESEESVEVSFTVLSDSGIENTVTLTQNAKGQVVKPSELFISEYVEGSSNNKYIEIYNPTDQDIDLSGYTVNCYTNGSTTPNNKHNLEGTLAAKTTLVLKHKQSNLYQGVAVESTATNFNGEKGDAISLSKNGENIDVWGVIGSSEDYGKDVTMRRNPDVIGPSATFIESQWTEYPKDDVSDLGKHTMNE